MISKALRLVRQYHNLSRIDAAKTLNIPKDELIRIETGDLPVTKDILALYSKQFDIPVSSLVFFSETLSPMKGKRARKLRAMFAGKALKILEWIANKDESKIKA
ncbi:helix-turn-helix domain-containing protein [Grimontia hollisae]|uniref:helix-turn-helix domain-containing protein n=1 Tax=Grimontia hollisae TaxID=673 RepID=UPI0012ACAAA6|nr:helix-turn-helix transcriptional regulator [Grimontia hollisae]